MQVAPTVPQSDETVQARHPSASDVSLSGTSSHPGMSPGLVWPSSNGFTQIDERSTLSPALVNVFLPARAKTLVSFLNANCGADGGAVAAAPADDTTTIGGSVVGAWN